MLPKVLPMPRGLRQAVLGACPQRDGPDGLFDIPYEDITQYLDSANDSLADPVVAGPRAVVALKRLFGHFGMDAMPQTLGQLLGALWYCKILQDFSDSPPVGPADTLLWEQSVDSTFAQHYPELLDALSAARKRDMPALRRIAREAFPFDVLSRHYHPTMGWAGGPHLGLLAQGHVPN